MRGFVNVIARFEESIKLIRKIQGINVLGSPTVTLTEEWNLNGAILPVKRDTDKSVQGVSVKTDTARLYVRLEQTAKKSYSVAKKTVSELGIESNDEIVARGIPYLIKRIARYERNLGFLVADIVQKPIPGGV